MTAQIIEFPMDRVRKPSSSYPRVTRTVEAQEPQVRTSVKVARAFIFWSLVASVVYYLFFSAGSSIESAQATNQAAQTVASDGFTYITVNPGDTLWSLAETYAPNRDPRDFISDLVALNSLNDSLISAGMRLALPAN